MPQASDELRMGPVFDTREVLAFFERNPDRMAPQHRTALETHND